MRSQDILVKSLTVDEGEADVVVQVEDIPEEEKWVYVQDQTFILLDSFMVNRPLDHFVKLMWHTKEEY